MEALGNHFWAKWWGKAHFSFTPWRPICFSFLIDWISDFIIASVLPEARRRLILLLPSGGGSLESLDTDGACSKTWLCNSAGTLTTHTVAFLWGVYLRLFTKSNTYSVSSQSLIILNTPNKTLYSFLSFSNKCFLLCCDVSMFYLRFKCVLGSQALSVVCISGSRSISSSSYYWPVNIVLSELRKPLIHTLLSGHFWRLASISSGQQRPRVCNKTDSLL